MLTNQTILVTGGTGSFGHTFVPMTLAKYNPKKIIIFSRDEMKQWEMAKLFQGDSRVRFFIGDVRDKDRLYRALDGVDYVVHAAATKIVPTAEYNPFECVKTNINGAMNLIDACIDKGVMRVVALSTDKASSPINLYGATKFASYKLFVAGNSYAGGHDIRFAVVRYGNVMGSRGSVIPFFMSIKDKGVLPITDARMTRFMISLEQGVELVWQAFDDMEGGEIYVKKIPSMKVTDLATVVAPEARQEVVGIRPGEKLHEQMIGEEDAFYTYEYPEQNRGLTPVSMPVSMIMKQLGLRVPALASNLGTSPKNVERWPQQFKAALEHLPPAHTLPGFGAARQVEHEVAALHALKILGALPDNADEFTLVTTLRITKAKARNLLYQDALRTLTSPQQVDDALRALVMQPTATNDGALLRLDVPQPFLMEPLAQRIHHVGFLRADSFPESIARVSRHILAALIGARVPPAERKLTAALLQEGDDLLSSRIGLIETAGQADRVTRERAPAREDHRGHRQRVHTPRRNLGTLSGGKHEHGPRLPGWGVMSANRQSRRFRPHTTPFFALA